MRGFLWCNGPMQKGKSKVSWKAICTPKSEGGLGIRRIGDMNKALMTAHIWSILTNRESLWVAWIHSYRLKGRNFWDCQIPVTCCWSWRKILQLRPAIRSFIWSSIGDGKSTSAWFDTWDDIGPLSGQLSPRDIRDAGLSLDSTVADIYVNGEWIWPVSWNTKFQGIGPITLIQDTQDRLCWKDGDDISSYSASRVWNSVRLRVPVVLWADVVWFSQCIPRHAFLMWLIVRGKLLTQDKIWNWNLVRQRHMNMMCCPLCFQGMDSHAHLFFTCQYSNQVWSFVRVRAGLPAMSPVWHDIMEDFCIRAKSKSIAVIVGKLIVAASAYFIWQERNNRLFNNHARPPDILGVTILSMVRYRLMGLRFKMTSRVHSMLGKWKIDADYYIDEGG